MQEAGVKQNTASTEKRNIFVCLVLVWNEYKRGAEPADAHLHCEGSVLQIVKN